MSSREIVIKQVPNTTASQNLCIRDLVHHLMQGNMTPTTLINNATLHSILLIQVILEKLTGVTAPAIPPGNFSYQMDAKDIVMFYMNIKNDKLIKELEERTGVNLNHYHKLKIGNKWT